VAFVDGSSVLTTGLGTAESSQPQRTTARRKKKRSLCHRSRPWAGWVALHDSEHKTRPQAAIVEKCCHCIHTCPSAREKEKSANSPRSYCNTHGGEAMPPHQSNRRCFLDFRMTILQSGHNLRNETVDCTHQPRHRRRNQLKFTHHVQQGLRDR
jgi:hypothetical protein